MDSPTGQPAEGLQDKVLVLAASPRLQGSTAHAAALVARGAERAGGQAEILCLSGLRLSGCDHCGTCSKAPFVCRQRGSDDTEHVFAALRAASQVVWISPVYFYGLPSQAKALADRGQRFYMAGCKGMPLPPAGRAAALLLAGQINGRRLFDGSRLAVTYFLSALGLRLEQSLGLRGVDTPADIRPEDALALTELGASLVLGTRFKSDRLETLSS